MAIQGGTDTSSGSRRTIDLMGKVALVTGGSRGLGRAICLALADVGADVIVASRDEAACETVAQEVRMRGRRSAAHGCHVGRWNEVDELVEMSYREFGRIDVLVNNAGKSPPYNDVLDITETHFDSVLGLNLKGPFRLATVVGSNMAEGMGGSIINISSIASLRPDPAAVPYAMAKAGLNALTAALAQALAPTVRINTVVPGAFNTDVSNHWNAETWETHITNAAMGRVGEPDEITGAVLYFASNASSYTTGSLLRVDGGVR